MTPGVSWRAVGGFSLTEVALAMGLAGFALLVVVSLLPIGVNLTRDAVEQTMAARLGRLILSDIEAADGLSAASTPRLAIPLATNQPFTLWFKAGLPASLNEADLRATVFQHQSQSSSLRTVRVLLTWPAAIDPETAAGRLEFLGRVRGEVQP
jgi:hypothetical protein